MEIQIGGSQLCFSTYNKNERAYKTVHSIASNPVLPMTVDYGEIEEALDSGSFFQFIKNSHTLLEFDIVTRNYCNDYSSEDWKLMKSITYTYNIDNCSNKTSIARLIYAVSVDGSIWIYDVMGKSFVNKVRKSGKVDSILFHPLYNSLLLGVNSDNGIFFQYPFRKARGDRS